MFIRVPLAQYSIFAIRNRAKLKIRFSYSDTPGINL